MSQRERVRLEALGRVKRGELTVVGASEVCGVSVRQMRRAWKRYKASGAKGLVHGLRGRASNRRTPVETAERVVKLTTERYHDFGATFACEKLLSEHGISISPDTLTALLKERGLWVRRRRRDRHRRRRERRACFGDMVQMDGSHHDWFEGRAGKDSVCVMMVTIDDATNVTDAKLYAGETTEAAFDVTRRWIEKHGVPCALYVDRASIYRDEEHPEKPTQFGRAMKELGVELIQARSPQAKGRVERRHAYFQNRFVRELRLRNINTIDAANALLAEVFVPELNRRLAVKPREDEDHHRGVTRGCVAAGEASALEEVLCVRETRVVGNDACVRWKNRWLQIDAANVHLARKRVTVKERGDGRLVIEHQGERLRFTELKSGRQSLRSRVLKVKSRKMILNNRTWKPSARHPWKRTPACDAPPPTPTPAAPGHAWGERNRKAG